jgi:DNA-binding HxlR family transcriptional regulator
MELEKITAESHKLTKERRSYEDACGMAHALDLLGERWTLIVLRELMLGSKRFSELRADIPGISANVLTQRLEGLEANGLVVRKKLPPPANAQVYELTPWGHETEPVMQAMGRWATRSPLHDPTAPISAVSVLLSFRTMLDRERAKGLDAAVGFRFGPYSYLGHLTEHGLPIVRGEFAEADLVFEGDHRALAGAVYGGVPLDQLVESGALKVTGPRWLTQRFLTLFPLPPKVA